MKTICCLILAAVVLCGCATSPNEISAAYVSPLKYKSYDCDQIAMEMDNVSHRVTELYQHLKAKSDGDAVKMGVGCVFLWPVLLCLDGNGSPEAVEYSQLKGDYEALRQAAIEKKCDLAKLPPSPDELMKAAQKADEEKAKQEQGASNSISRGH